jgi:hypothetical protein
VSHVSETVAVDELPKEDLPMNWNAVIEFVRSRNAAAAQAMTGVPEEDIRSVEKGLQIVLPTDYRGFLTVMGRESGDCRPFGATQSHDFYELVELMSDETLEAPRYFRVTRETDLSEISPHSLYLDLARSDGRDAPLVAIEDDEPPEPNVAEEVGLTVTERLVQGIFRCFEHDLYPEKEAIVIHKVAPDGADTLMTRIVQLLEESGLAPAMPLQRRVVCFSGDGMSVLAGVKEHLKMINVTVSGTDAARVKNMAEGLRHSLPGATVPQGL